LYSDCGHTRVTGFSDVDWADSPIDMRFTCYCVFVREIWCLGEETCGITI